MNDPIPTKVEAVQSSELIEEIAWQCLVEAVKRFNMSDDRQTLLCSRNEEAEPNGGDWAAANETTIAHRLGFYIECGLRLRKKITDRGPLVVDCEYNRHIYDRKKLHANNEYLDLVRQAGRNPIPLADRNGDFELFVFPDIIVHERQTNANLLIVELKKRTSTEQRSWEQRYDEFKLKLFTTAKPNGYGYKLGAWVVVEDNCVSSMRNLRIVSQYKDGVKTMLVA